MVLCRGIGSTLVPGQARRIPMHRGLQPVRQADDKATAGALDRLRELKCKPMHACRRRTSTRGSPRHPPAWSGGSTAPTCHPCRSRLSTSTPRSTPAGVRAARPLCTGCRVDAHFFAHWQLLPLPSCKVSDWYTFSADRYTWHWPPSHCQRVPKVHGMLLRDASMQAGPLN